MLTRNIQIDRERLWTPHDVTFRFGPNHGSGRDMIVTLEKPEAGDLHGNPAGVRSLELVQVDRIHLEVGGELLPLDDDDTAKAPQDGQRVTPKSQPDRGKATPVEVTCQGSLLVDFAERLITLEEQVDVLRVHPVGPSDQLTCRMLQIFLSRGAMRGLQKDRNTAIPVAEANSDPIERIVALGHPVVVHSPSTQAAARGQRLEYDFLRRRISLEGGDQVTLQHEGHAIEATRLQYDLGDDGDIGRIWAAGPGRFISTQLASAASPTKNSANGRPGHEPEAGVNSQPAARVEARWQEQLRLQPDGDQHVLSLTGGAEFGSPTMGRVSAREMHLWLRKPAKGEELATPGAKDDNVMGDLVPDRMLAQGQVTLEGQLAGSTERLEVWIDPLPADADLDNSQDPQGQPAHSLADSRESKQDDRRYRIQGKRVRVRLLRNSETTKLADATIEGAAVFQQLPTGEEPAPLTVQGDTFQIRQAESSDAQLRVAGKPALVSARGLSMQGLNVHLDQGSNRLWIDSPGEIKVPITHVLGKAKVKQPGIMSVRWEGSMDFDGRVVKFDKNVVADSTGHRLTTDVARLLLTRNVDFSDTDQVNDIDIRQIECQGNVQAESRSLEKGLITSVSRMAVPNLKLDYVTGDINAQGSGWMSSVRRGGISTSRLGGGRARKPDSGTGLSYMYLEFQREATGNLHDRELQFRQDVHVIHGPVANWSDVVDPDGPQGLGEQGILLTTDQLSVVDMGDGDKITAVELEAIGNTLVEGNQFTARANRMAYTESKDLLVLEGTGRADAELWRETTIGGPRYKAAARRIHYWRSSNRIEVDDARYLDLRQMGLQPAPSRRQ